MLLFKGIHIRHYDQNSTNDRNDDLAKPYINTLGDLYMNSLHSTTMTTATAMTTTSHTAKANTTEGKNDRINKVASNIFRLVVIDAGTRDLGIRVFEYDPETRRVYHFMDKEDINKNADLQAKLSEAKYRDYPVIINMTSWARKQRSTQEELRFIASAAVLEHSDPERIKVSILSQKEEAKLVQQSVEHYFKYKNIFNPALATVTPETVTADDMGNGSTQNAYLLPEQTKEMAGKWASDQIKNGKPLDDVAKATREIITKDLQPRSEARNKQDLVIVGLSAIALKNKHVLASLNIKGDKKQEWETGQITKKLTTVITSLEAEIKRLDDEMKEACDNALQDPEAATLLESLKATGSSETKEAEEAGDGRLALITHIINNQQLKETSNASLKKVVQAFAAVEKEGTPLALTLGKFQAFHSRYKKDFNVLTISADVPFYNPKTKQMDKATKLNVSHGAAVQYFTESAQDLTRFGELKKSLEDAERRYLVAQK